MKINTKNTKECPNIPNIDGQPFLLTVLKPVGFNKSFVKLYVKGRDKTTNIIVVSKRNSIFFVVKLIYYNI